MARTREIVCEFYVCEGNCSKGREGTFNKCCQTCNKYRKKAGAKPRRVDERNKKMNKITSKEAKREMKNY